MDYNKDIGSDTESVTSASTQASKSDDSKKLNYTEILNDPVKYKEFMDDLKRSQENSRKVCESISNTMTNLTTTIQEVQKTNQKFEEFKDAFKEAIGQIAQNLSKTLGGAKHKQTSEDPEMQPRPGNPNNTAEIIANSKNVLFLTGAGLSVASGIPTFRGEGGFWTLRDKKEKIKANEFLTSTFKKEHPEEIWKWHHHLKRMVDTHKPNKGHRAIASLQLAAQENQTDVKVNLVTQNIDGYHTQAINDLLKEKGKKPITKKVGEVGYGFNDYVYCIHGDIQYLRCNEECTQELFPYPNNILDDTFIPKCPKCNGNARAHTLLFDESYNQHFYRVDTVNDIMNEIDCLVVIGTALETNLASRMVDTAIEKKIPIIELNPNPCIHQGKVYQVLCDSEEALPIMCKALQEKISPPNKKSPTSSTGKKATMPSSSKAVVGNRTIVSQNKNISNTQSKNTAVKRSSLSDVSTKTTTNTGVKRSSVKSHTVKK